MLAMEDKASIFCAREILGTESIERTFILSLEQDCNKSGLTAGLKKDIRVLLLSSLLTSPSFGLLIFKMISEAQT